MFTIFYREKGRNRPKWRDGEGERSGSLWPRKPLLYKGFSVAGPKGVEPLSMVPETIVLSIELQALNAVRKLVRLWIKSNYKISKFEVLGGIQGGGCRGHSV